MTSTLDTTDPPLTRQGHTEAPLSYAQERLWFIEAAAPGTATYNVPFLLRFTGPVDPGALAQAVHALVDRHEILRTRYRAERGTATQHVSADDGVGVEVIDLAQQPDAAQRLADDVDARARAPFDLAADLPVRCTVWTGVPGGDAVLLTFHHIAVDGWSTGTLFGDLDTAYTAALAGRAPDWPEPVLQYADFAAWDRRVTDTPEVAARTAERAAELRGYPTTLTLGHREPRPAAPATRPGDQVIFELPPAQRDAVHAFARSVRATPFAVLLAAYQVLLQRWSGADDFLVGTVTANRPHPATEGLVGFFVNTVPLRCSPRPDQTFRDLCLSVRAESFRALSYQRIPFQHLSAAVGGGALVHVGFALQNAPMGRANGRWRTPAQVPTGTAKFDLFLICEEGPDSVIGTIEYDVDAYPATLAIAFAEQYPVLLAAALADPDAPLRGLPLTEPGSGLLPPCVLVGAVRDLVAAHGRGVPA